MSIFSNVQKEIYDLVLNETAFTNPKESFINAAKDSLATELPNIIAAGSFDPSDESDITDAFDDLGTTLDDFLEHTNRLSGVNFDSLSTPDVNVLMSIGNAREKILTEIEGLSTDEVLEKGKDLFGSICQLSNSEFESFQTQLVTIATKLDAGLVYDAIDIINLVNQFDNLLQGQKDLDNLAYSTALNELRRLAMMHNLQGALDGLALTQSVLQDCGIGTGPLLEVLNLSD